jgi:hypothetical protein
MAALKGTCSINLRKQIEARNPSGSLYAPRACFKETQRALQVRAIKGVFKNQKPECTSSDTRRRWDVLMNRKFIVAVLLVVAVPVYAQAQNPRVSKGDQLVDLFAVFLLVGHRHLLSEFLYIAIGLDFDFVAADDCPDLLCCSRAD